MQRQNEQCIVEIIMWPASQSWCPGLSTDLGPWIHSIDHIPPCHYRGQSTIISVHLALSLLLSIFSDIKMFSKASLLIIISNSDVCHLLTYYPPPSSYDAFSQYFHCLHKFCNMSVYSKDVIVLCFWPPSFQNLLAELAFREEQTNGKKKKLKSFFSTASNESPQSCFVCERFTCMTFYKAE